MPKFTKRNRKSFVRKHPKEGKEDKWANNHNRDYRFKGINTERVKPEPFPRVLYTRTKYAEQGFLTVATPGLSVGNTFRVNSIHDPNFTGGVGSTTVVGFTQLAAIYERYIVIGCKIMVSFNNPTRDDTRVGVRLRIRAGGSAINESIRGLQEQPMTYMSGINDSGSQRKSFSLFVRPWSLIGVSKLEYMANTSKYSSPMNGSPIDVAFMDIFCANPTEGTTVSYVVKMIHYVQLYDRIYLAASVF